jgi:glycine cleavage system H protein
MSIPSHLRYTTSHEWLSVDGDLATVGITSIAADALGDIVFVELPRAGDELTVGQVCGEIESTKSVTELYSPAGGNVAERNEALSGEPGLINSDPYGAGWLFRMHIEHTDDLLDAEAYAVLTEEGSTSR